MPQCAGGGVSALRSTAKSRSRFWFSGAALACHRVERESRRRYLMLAGFRKFVMPIVPSTRSERNVQEARRSSLSLPGGPIALPPVTFDPVADATRLGRLQATIVLAYLVVFVSLCQAQTPAESSSAQRSDGAASRKSLPPATATNPALMTVVTVTGQPLDISLAPASVSVVDGDQVKDAA